MTYSTHDVQYSEWNNRTMAGNRERCCMEHDVDVGKSMAYYDVQYSGRNVTKGKQLCSVF